MKALIVMIKKRSTPDTIAGKERDPELVAIGKRLQILSVKAGFRKQAPLARAAKIPPGTLSSYILGDRRMSYDNAKALSAVLSTTVDYLFTGKNLSTLAGDTKASQQQSAAQETVRICLFNLRDVPYFRMLKNKLDFSREKMTTLDLPELILKQAYIHLNGKRDQQIDEFVVKMDGDKSMEPKVQRDAMALVCPSSDCQPGKTVLAVFESLGVAAIRTFVIERGADRKPRKIMRALDGINPDLELNEAAGDWCWPVGLIITPP